MTSINGIDLDALSGHKIVKKQMPPTVPGRTVHIDADFLAYQVAYDDSKTIDEMCHNAEVGAEKLRLMAGAQYMTLHLTPKGSDKGKRFDIALLKEYQATRKDKVKPRYLHLIRKYMHDRMAAVDHMHCEADDGMSMAQYTAIAKGDFDKTVIASKDKDLRMVPGWSLDWDTGELTTTTNKPFGWIDLNREKSTPKITGRGWKYFWAQMLTGDAADNISGLPKCLDLNLVPKPKPVGAVLAAELLKDIDNNKDAFELVKSLYKLYGEHEDYGFKDWRTEQPVAWGVAMVSEMKLLWMRREIHEDDVLKWLKEHGI